MHPVNRFNSPILLNRKRFNLTIGLIWKAVCSENCLYSLGKTYWVIPGRLVHYSDILLKYKEYKHGKKRIITCTINKLTLVKSLTFSFGGKGREIKEILYEF